MKQRLYTSIIIALVYASTILMTIYVSRFFYDTLIVFMMILSGYEMSRAIATKFDRPIGFFIVLNSVMGYAAFYVVHHYIGNQSGGITAFFGQLFLIFIVCIIYNMATRTISIKNVISTMFVLVYPISILTYLLAINYAPGGANYSNLAILLTFGISCFTDVFAYLTGFTFRGRGPKLAPVVSPKKTVIGAIGGLFGGVFAAMAVFLLARSGMLRLALFSTDDVVNLVHFCAIGLVGSVCNQLGDLIASYIKRTCDIKDFSALLPGHGGMMDRVDGMMLVAVFMFGYFTLFQVIAGG